MMLVRFVACGFDDLQCILFGCPKLSSFSHVVKPDEFLRTICIAEDDDIVHDDVDNRSMQGNRTPVQPFILASTSGLMRISLNLLLFNSMQVEDTVKLTLHSLSVINGQNTARDEAIQTITCLKVCHVSVMSGEQITSDFSTSRSFLNKTDSDDKTIKWSHVSYNCM